MHSNSSFTTNNNGNNTAQSSSSSVSFSNPPTSPIAETSGVQESPKPKRESQKDSFQIQILENIKRGKKSSSVFSSFRRRSMMIGSSGSSGHFSVTHSGISINMPEETTLSGVATHITTGIAVDDDFSKDQKTEYMASEHLLTEQSSSALLGGAGVSFSTNASSRNSVQSIPAIITIPRTRASMKPQSATEREAKDEISESGFLETDEYSALIMSHKASTISNFIQRFQEVEAPLLQFHSCALERDILWQGRLYISTRALCFYSKIFGNETKQVIWFSDITSIEKCNVAGVIPNAITIYTKKSNFFFASFLKRDHVYDFIQALHLKNQMLSTVESKSIMDFVKEPSVGAEAMEIVGINELSTIELRSPSKLQNLKIRLILKTFFIMTLALLIFLSFKLITLFSRETPARLKQMEAAMTQARIAHMNMIHHKLEGLTNAEGHLRERILELTKKL